MLKDKFRDVLKERIQHRVAQKFPKECEDYNIIYFIDSAKNLLD